MAQHDYVIANGTGAAVRSDLNGGLAAIVSNNSGATEPATMYAYQWWPDTTTGLLKIRNSANNAWVTVGTLASANLGLATLASPTFTGTVTGPTFTASTAVNIPLGSQSSPTLFFTGDTNTGVFSPGADQVAITTGGTQRVTVDTAATTSTLPIVHPLGAVGTPSITFTGDLNTGIYSPAADTIAFSEGGAEAMRIDSSARLLVGTSTTLNANRFLQVAGLGAELIHGSADAIGPTINLSKSRTSLAAPSALSGSDILGNVDFSGYDGLSYKVGARIHAIIDNAPGNNDLPTALVFSTTADSASTPTERMRIDSNGNLMVGRQGTLIASAHAFDAGGAAVLATRNSGSAAGKYWQVGPDSNSAFKVYNQDNVGMFMSDGSTSWSSSSDEKLKNIIEPITNAIEKVAELRSVIGSYKSDDDQRRRAFLIAQDVEKVLPEAVTETPDGFLGVAYTDVIPLLVAALNESKERIETLEAKVAALESA